MGWHGAASDGFRFGPSGDDGEEIAFDGPSRQNGVAAPKRGKHDAAGVINPTTPRETWQYEG